MTLAERDQYSKLQAELAKSAARTESRRAQDNGIVVNVIKVSNHYFVTASVGDETLNGTEAQIFGDLADAKIAAGVMAASLGTNDIRVML